MLIFEFDASVAYWLPQVYMPPVNLMKVLFTMFTSATCFSNGTEHLSAAFLKWRTRQTSERKDHQSFLTKQTAPPQTWTLRRLMLFRKFFCLLLYWSIKQGNNQVGHCWLSQQRTWIGFHMPKWFIRFTDSFFFYSNPCSSCGFSANFCAFLTDMNKLVPCNRGVFPFLPNKQPPQENRDCDSCFLSCGLIHTFLVSYLF